MLTKEKKLLIAIIILLLIFATTFTIMKNNNKKTNERNNSNNDIVTIKKDYDLNGITISNINIYTDENGRNFSAKITNTSNNDIKVKLLTAIFYDKNNDPVIEKYFLQNISIAKDNTQYINLYGDSELDEMINVDFKIEYE